VLATIEQTSIDKYRARSFRTGVDNEPVHFAHALAGNSEYRCAEFDLHSGPSRILARDASRDFSDWYLAPARIWHVGCLIAYRILSAEIDREEITWLRGASVNVQWTWLCGLGIATDTTRL
jgi:hypothetical protein